MKQLAILIITFGLLSLFASTAQALAVEKGDLFAVYTPFTNQTIFGDFKLRFVAYDEGKEQLPYRLELLDAECQTVRKTLKSGLVPSSKQHQSLDIALTDVNTIDSKACLQMCIALETNGNYAVVCGNRKFTTTTDSSPSFQSAPAGVISIGNRENWSFNLAVTNAEQNDIVLLGAPDFVKLENDQKLTIADNAIKAPGTYPIWLKLVGQKNMYTIHKFDLIIQTTADSIDFVSSESENASPADIIVLSPVPGTVFSGATGNVIDWIISENDGFQEIRLSYIDSAGNNQPIAFFNNITGTVHDTSYNWNVSSIADGQYIVKISVTDKLGNVSEKMSGEITIANSATGPIETKPLIFNIVPAEDAEVKEKVPTITGSFAASFGQTIVPETFLFKIDNIDQKQGCTADRSGFSCVPANELANGRHQISVSIADSSNKRTTRDWIIEVKFETTPTPTPEPGPEVPAGAVVIGGLIIPRGVFLTVFGICCVAFILLVIPWLLYLLWGRKGKKSQSQSQPGYNEAYNYYPQPQPTPYYPQPVGYSAPPQPIASPVPQSPEAYGTYPETQPIPVEQQMPQPAPVAPQPVAAAPVPPPPTPGSSTQLRTPDWLSPKNSEIRIPTPHIPPYDPPQQQQ